MRDARSTSFGQSGGSFLDHLIESIRLRNIIGHIPRNGILVDLGCGYDANLLTFLSPRLKQGIGLDLSVSKHPKSNNVQLKSARADKRLPLKSNSVDGVTALATIEHVEHPEVLLNESFRILKPGGILLLTTPAAHAKPLLEFMAFKLHIISDEEIGDHKQYFTKKTLNDAIVKAGFSKNKVDITTFELGFNLFAKARK